MVFSVKIPDYFGWGFFYCLIISQSIRKLRKHRLKNVPVNLGIDKVKFYF